MARWLSTATTTQQTADRKYYAESLRSVLKGFTNIIRLLQELNNVLRYKLDNRNESLDEKSSKGIADIGSSNQKKFQTEY